MRLDFDFVFLALGGKEVHNYNEKGEDEGVSKAHVFLAGRLANWPKAKDRVTAYKYTDLAERLYKNGWLEVGRSDRRLIEDLIEQDPIMSAIIQSQLFTVIEKAEKAEEKSQKEDKTDE